MTAVRIPALTTQTATLIFSHGLGDTGAGWSSLAKYLRSVSPVFKQFAFIFPNAPTIPITCNGGFPMPGWYDIQSFAQNASQDKSGILKSVGTISNLISEELSKGITSERIFIGGFSQGSALSIVTGLTSKYKLGGIICLSGYIPIKDYVEEAKTQFKSPIFMGHGDADDVVPYKWGISAKEYLENLNYNVEFHSYNGMAHSSSDKELQDLAAWLQRLV